MTEKISVRGKCKGEHYTNYWYDVESDSMIRSVDSTLIAVVRDGEWEDACDICAQKIEIKRPVDGQIALAQKRVKKAPTSAKHGGNDIGPRTK